MPDGLTYLGKKCVLEYLEANKRIHISSRCPHLKRIDHSVPFHINTLAIYGHYVTVNGFGYHMHEEIESIQDDPRNQLEKGDVLIGSKKAFYDRKYPTIGFYNNERQVVPRRVPGRDSKIMETHVAIKKMYEKLFGGRENIWVDRLKFSLMESTILRLPVGFSVRTRKLDSGRLNPDHFICLLHPSSFPLYELTLEWPKKLNQSIVQSSAKLIIHDFSLFPQHRMENLMRLEHSNVTVIVSGHTVFYRVIEYWLNHRQETTSACFKWTATCNNELKMFVEGIRGRFPVVIKTMCDTSYNTLPNSNYISIPLNDTSYIAIYGVRQDIFFSTEIVMETMDVRTFSPPHDFHHLKPLVPDYVVEEKINKKKSCEIM